MEVINTTVPQHEPVLSESLPLVIKRSGEKVEFDSGRIFRAVEKAFRADQGISSGSVNDRSLLQAVGRTVEAVVQRILAEMGGREAIDLEQIQNFVEHALMELGHYSVAKKYIVYRDEHARARLLKNSLDGDAESKLGENIDLEDIGSQLNAACAMTERCRPELLIKEVSRTLYEGATEKEVERALTLAARCKIEEEPEYSRVAAMLLLGGIYKEVFGVRTTPAEAVQIHRNYFKQGIERGVAAKRLSPQLLEFDLRLLAEEIDPRRDEQFRFMGLQTLYDRYLLHINGVRFETPQLFWMRVAMGLALNEKVDREKRASEFYRVLSSFRFICSTPTLFNSGTLHPQLSSCFLTTVQDDLIDIFKSISDNARLSKWAGGLGNDWTNVRALGAKINGTNGESQGIVPFLKVANDTAVAVNQGGKRQGAVCAYLETWHLDIEEFLELRKNTGDERRRTHDMNTSNWIPDLFMKRVRAGEIWTLFSPDETPDLHDLFGSAFEERYCYYEAEAAAGRINKTRQIPAADLWKKMLSMLFETGHPWITFKDPPNVRSPQKHAGVVHSSNLCTEILLNTSADETAVCNLGSVNLVTHIGANGLDSTMLQETIQVAVRMLDNVIDINFYPTVEAENANKRHRPIGLGLMGFQDALYLQGISYASQQAAEFADLSMEMISHAAILASSKLAKEKGRYSSYEGSLWSKNIFPIDSIEMLEQERGEPIAVDRTIRLNWQSVREHVQQHGMRNSNVMAIAPTATIANIIGVSQSIEPTYRNLFVKSNLSGDFTSINEYLIKDLRTLNMWDQEMIDDLKYYDGSVLEIERIPNEIRERYRTAFELEPKWLIECAARRQKWIDMGQSLNLYVTSISGRALSEMYFNAWNSGLKTTYYLRSQAATQVEKSNLDINKRGIQPRWMKNQSASNDLATEVKACSIDDPGCEVCQ
jgi:ribonucleoside-diphosphate reductase alpha chain